MKAKDVNSFLICRAHCDLIAVLSVNLKAMFFVDQKKAVLLSKERALSMMEDIQNSLNELRLEIEGMEEL